jgi:DNA-binding IclR family transcriptional regulator
MLASVAEEGTALEDGEAIVGEAEIAAPVFDDRGHSVGAIGVVGPVERLLPEGRHAAAIVTAVRETSRGLSRDMGAGRVGARSGAARR